MNLYKPILRIFFSIDIPPNIWEHGAKTLVYYQFRRIQTLHSNKNCRRIQYVHTNHQEHISFSKQTSKNLSHGNPQASDCYQAAFNGIFMLTPNRKWMSLAFSLTEIPAVLHNVVSVWFKMSLLLDSHFDSHFKSVSHVFMRFHFNLSPCSTCALRDVLLSLSCRFVCDFSIYFYLHFKDTVKRQVMKTDEGRESKFPSSWTLNTLSVLHSCFVQNVTDMMAMWKAIATPSADKQKRWRS